MCGGDLIELWLIKKCKKQELYQKNKKRAFAELENKPGHGNNILQYQYCMSLYIVGAHTNYCNTIVGKTTTILLQYIAIHEN